MNRRFILFLACLFFSIGLALAQNKRVSGTVVDENGDPVIGATVQVKGTTIGVSTDIQGKYSIQVPQTGKSLIVSLIGSRSKEVSVEDNQKIVLVSDSKALNEVVVTALGISRDRKALGYAVQDVKGDDINNTRTGNIMTSLEGKAAGVNITSSSGAAGSSSFITIRGQNSILGNNQPLFVVDGIPVDNSMSYSGNPDDQSNNLVEGVNYSNRAMDLNSDDIESVSVLKGGAATALYGMKAANGVVLVTTKSGKGSKGKTKVSYSSSISFERVNKLPEMQSMYAQGLNGKYSTTTPYSFGPLLSDMRYDGSSDVSRDKNGNLVLATDPSANQNLVAKAYDNVGDFFRTGYTYNNNISLSGGNDKGNFYVSVGNITTTGVIPRNTYGKTSLKIAGETKLLSNLTLSGSANYIHSGGDRLQQGSNTSGVMLGLLRGAVSFDNSNGHGKDGYKYTDAYMYDDGTQRAYAGYDNPYWTVNKNIFTDKVDRIMGYLSLVYKPIKDVSISYKIGNDFYSDKRKGHLAMYSASNSIGEMQLDNHFSNAVNSDLIASYNHKLSKDFDLNVIVGQNMYYSFKQQTFIKGTGFVVPDFYHISNTSSQVNREIETEYKTAAFYGDAHLSYKDMLFFGVTGRNEWSTSLPENSNSFFYPSANFGFIFSELKGIKDLGFLNYGKFRASYSKIANDPSPYSLSNVYTLGWATDGWTSGISFPFGGVSGFAISNALGNPTLKPEKLISRELGLELKFFNSRVGLDFSYYNNQNKDLILPVPISGSSGYNSVYMNAATMENKGIELTATLVPVKTRDWNWSILANFTKNNNKVLSLANGVDNIELGGFTGITINVVAGEPYGSIYSTGFLKDANGNVVINDNSSSAGYGYPIKDETMKSLGSVAPKWTLNFTNQLTYKGVSLSFLVDIKHGGLLWDGTRGRMLGFGTAKDTENRGQAVVFEGVKGHEDASGNLVTSGTNDIQTTYSEYYYRNIGGGASPAQEQFVEKASWVRLREVSLSCDLGRYIKTPVLSKMNVFATGRNLFLHTPYKGIDPETNLMGASNAQGLDYFNMPNTKSFVLGFKLDF